MPAHIDLSILVLSLLERRSTFLPRLLDSLDRQVRGRPVEVLVLMDNGRREIGEKRNQLKAMARGAYICYIDDDDRIAEHYVDAILSALTTGPDVVVFDAWVTLDGKAGKICKYGYEFNPANRREAYYRKPNHLMVHKRQNVRAIPFKEISLGEDDEWAARVAPHIKSQVRIDDTLYYYEYNRSTSRSSKERKR